jgi:hypothetical protein
MWRNGAGEVGSDRVAVSRRTQSFWRVLQPRFDDRESRDILPLSGLIDPLPAGPAPPVEKWRMSNEP